MYLREIALSALVRVRDEEEFLFTSVASIADLVEEIVIVDNIDDNWNSFDSRLTQSNDEAPADGAVELVKLPCLHRRRIAHFEIAFMPAL
jgi:hypothetical protein